MPVPRCGGERRVRQHRRLVPGETRGDLCLVSLAGRLPAVPGRVPPTRCRTGWGSAPSRGDLGQGPGVCGPQALSGTGDYRAFAHYLTQALHRWGVLPEGTGFVDGKLSPRQGSWCSTRITPSLSCMGRSAPISAGRPNGDISLSHGITAQVENQRLSFAALSLDGKPLADSKEVLLTAVGRPGWMKPSKAPWSSSPACPSPPALSRASCTPTLGRGALIVTGNATLTALDVYGNELEKISGEAEADGTRFALAGDLPATALSSETELRKGPALQKRWAPFL